jgi:hypothetical protein
MKKPILILTILFLTCTLSLFAQPTFQWTIGIGGIGTDAVGVSNITSAGGDIYTTGYFSATVDFNPSIGVFNLNSVGNEDIFITKLDASGNFLWAKSIGGPFDDRVRCIATDNSGNIYITGDFLSPTVDFDPGAGVFNLNSIGAYDIFIVKLDSSGNFLWAKTIGGTDFDS